MTLFAIKRRGEGVRCAGVDEAGRGPLAGPVVAAAVILNPRRRISGLADSKVLPAEERERLAPIIRERALAWAVAWSSARLIRYDPNVALKRLMRLSLARVY